MYFASSHLLVFLFFNFLFLSLCNSYLLLFSTLLFHSFLIFSILISSISFSTFLLFCAQLSLIFLRLSCIFLSPLSLSAFLCSTCFLLSVLVRGFRFYFSPIFFDSILTIFNFNLKHFLIPFFATFYLCFSNYCFLLEYKCWSYSYILFFFCSKACFNSLFPLLPHFFYILSTIFIFSRILIFLSSFIISYF